MSNRRSWMALAYPTLGLFFANAQPLAYVANYGSNSVSVIDVAAKALKMPTPIPVGTNPWGVAVSPDGSRVYVSNSSTQANSISVIDTGTNTVVDTIQITAAPTNLPPTALGLTAMAITPDGRQLYVTHFSAAVVYPIDLTTSPKKTVGNPIAVGVNPLNMAMAPNGTRLYVTSEGGLNAPITVIDTGSNKAVGSIVSSGAGNPNGIAISPDGNTAYVGHDTYGSFLSVIDVQHGVFVKILPVSNGGGNTGVVIDPAGSNVYVANGNNPGTLTQFGVSNQVFLPSVQIAVPPSIPGGLAMVPGGGSVYITNRTANSVSVFDTASKTVSVIVQVGSAPMGIAFSGAPVPQVTELPSPVTSRRSFEPSIAADPVHPEHAVVAYNDLSESGQPAQCGWVESFDSGVSWSSPRILSFPKGFSGGGDPWARFDPNGTLYVSCLGQTQFQWLGLNPFIKVRTVGVFVAVSKSGKAADLVTQKVATYEQFCSYQQSVLHCADPQQVNFDGDVTDHPSIAFLSLEHGAVTRAVVAWVEQNAPGTFSVLKTAFSDDGSHWSISGPVKGPYADLSTIAGNLHVLGLTWYDSHDHSIYLSTSTDGVKWSRPALLVDTVTSLAPGTGGTSSEVVSPPYAMAFPGNSSDMRIVWENRTDRSTVYWADVLLDPSSSEVSLGPREVLGNASEKFLPGIGTCPSVVGAYERVNITTGPFRYRLWKLEEPGSSRSIFTSRADLDASVVPNRRIGEYTGVDCSQNVIWAAWTDLRSGIPQIWGARIH